MKYEPPVSTTRARFGKYQGCLLSDLPVGALEWLLRSQSRDLLPIEREEILALLRRGEPRRDKR